MRPVISSRMEPSSAVITTRLTLSLPRVINFEFPCSLPRNMTSHSMKNLAFHSLLRGKIIILPILTTSLIHFSLNGWDNVLFELGSERVNSKVDWDESQREGGAKRTCRCACIRVQQPARPRATHPHASYLQVLLRAAFLVLQDQHVVCFLARLSCAENRRCLQFHVFVFLGKEIKKRSMARIIVTTTTTTMLMLTTTTTTVMSTMMD